MKLIIILAILAILVNINPSAAPIHDAAMEGDSVKVQAELDKGVNVNLKSEWLDTPLHIAVQIGHEILVKFLISKGATVNSKNKDGRTPLDYADGDVASILQGHGSKHGSIHSAAEHGNLDGVREFLNAGVDVNAQANWDSGLEIIERCTPLHYAAHYRQRIVTEFLIVKGADVNAKNEAGKTPLDYTDGVVADILRENGGKYSSVFSASQHGDVDGVREILNLGINVNSVDFVYTAFDFSLKGQTALHIATRAGHKEVVQLLIDEGAIINFLDMNRMTPLDLSIISDREITDILLKAGAKTREEVNAFFDTTKQLQLAAVENSITTGADVNAMDSEGSTALHYVASEGSLEIAELLISKGANVDSMDNYHRTPLHSAIAGGQIKMATLLITSGANINANAKGYILTSGGTALDYASNGIEKIKGEGGSEDLIQKLNEFSKLLRKNGGKTSQELETAESIFAAVLHGNMEAIERYLKDGVDINAADANGLTPLAWAAVNDTPFEIAKFLIDNGANVNARDHIENTPLHDAAGAGHREIVAMLISKGADLNARNKDGKTPIDLAAEWQQETVDLLRKLGGRTGQEIDENMPYNSFEKGQLIIYSNIGLKYDVLYSADLRKWQLLDDVTIDAYPKIHVDKTAAEQPVRFYKLRLK